VRVFAWRCFDSSSTSRSGFWGWQERHGDVAARHRRGIRACENRRIQRPYSYAITDAYNAPRPPSSTFYPVKPLTTSNPANASQSDFTAQTFSESPVRDYSGNPA